MPSTYLLYLLPITLCLQLSISPLLPSDLLLPPSNVCLSPTFFRLLPFAFLFPPNAICLSPISRRLSSYALHLLPLAFRLSPFSPFSLCLVPYFQLSPTFAFFGNQPQHFNSPTRPRRVRVHLGELAFWFTRPLGELEI